jgi:hypothetical protein
MNEITTNTINKPEFMIAFQLTSHDIFEVSYYTLDRNPHPYFSTMGARFYKNKRGFCEYGQCQETVTKRSETARKFYEKWNEFHCIDLTQEQYNEMVSDLEKLKDKYNYMIQEFKEKDKPYSPWFYKETLLYLSRQTPKWKLPKDKNTSNQ